MSVTPERPPQLRDVVLERMPRRPRRGLAPDVLHETIGRDGLAGAERQNGENGALLPPADREHPFSVPNLEGPEELDVQHGAFLHAPARANKLAGRPAHAHHAPVRSHPPSRADRRRRSRSCSSMSTAAPRSFRGENGKIAFAGARDGNFEIYVVEPGHDRGCPPHERPEPPTPIPPGHPEGRRITFTTNAERERRHLSHERRRDRAGAADHEPRPRLELDVVALADATSRSRARATATRRSS